MSTTLPPSSQASAAASRPRKPLVDAFLRTLHATLALGFVVSYLTSESEAWQTVHVYSGYTLAGVLVLRALWGLVGPTPARWSVLYRRVSLWRVWWPKLQAGQWLDHSVWVGVSAWLLAATVTSIYFTTLFSIATGLASYNEWLGDGLLDDVVHELHEGLGNMTLFLVLTHLSLVVVLRLWRGPQAVRPMWRGHANSARRG
jgi:cytochrome b